MQNQIDTIIFTPEKSKQIALARLDLIHKWLEFRRKANNKLQADYDFANLHNTTNSHLFQIIGKISRGSLHRWHAMLGGTDDYQKLLPQYKYSTVREYRTVLTDEEIKIFMGLLLHPNRISIGKATALTKYKLREQGQNFIPADITFRRYAMWFKNNNYDQWVLARDGEKALSDKVKPYIKRDASLLDVGDILVADGHKLAFQVINPFTGKPSRATLVGFLDWKSTALVGYEIMLEENVQCIASALRNAIINLDMIPKIVYQDNGRAFRAKYFTDDKGFGELGFYGLYAKLGIETVFAKPYNARAKVIERFFKEFQEGFEKLLPSYVGSSIGNKPAYLLRNEKLHKNWHSDYLPTIDEAIKMIDMWLNFKNSQPCTNAPNMTIAEVLEARKRKNIDINQIDDLMLATEVKTIQRNGIRFLNCDYVDERLYGFKGKVLIRYNLFDLKSIKVFTPKGKYLCTAERVTETHPMAKILGTVEDMEDFKQKIQKQKRLKRKTINNLKAYLPQEEIKLIEASSPEFQTDKSAEILPSPPFAIASRRGATKEPVFQTEFKECSTIVQGIFKNNAEKYEYLIKNNPDDVWITEFKKTKEYRCYMNKTFVKTQNVRNFIGLIENLQNKPKSIPKMALVYGEPGLGKSQTALWLACKYDAIYLRAAPQLIIIDEIDYLMNDFKTIETLRDIHDKTECPIVFVGMSLVHKKLERYKHLYDRFSEIVKFKTFGVDDLKQIFDSLSEIPFTTESIEYIHPKYNRFRQIVQLINQLETYAKDNGITEYTLETIRGLL